jgi:hypothetical protein
MYEDHTDVFLLAGLACAMLIVVVAFVSTQPENKFMGLGDEVATTDEYNTLFNDSFSGRIVGIGRYIIPFNNTFNGRVVAKDYVMYTVRDEIGTERIFEWKWLEKVDADGSDDEIKTCPEAIGTIKTTAHTPNTILSMNASTAMSVSIRDEQGHPMIWIDNTSGVVWMMVSNGHQVPVNVADIENIETTYSYIDTFEYAPQSWTEKRETGETQ